MNTVDNDVQSDLLREVAPKKKPSALPKIIVMLLLAGVVGFYLFLANEPAKNCCHTQSDGSGWGEGLQTQNLATVQPAAGSESESVANAPAVLIPKSEVDSAAKNRTYPWQFRESNYCQIQRDRRTG